MSDSEPIDADSQYETSFTKEMKFGFSNYAKYVISDRAIPDARDGLKPVHRRILWAMNQIGLGPRSPFKKCARIFGEVTGKYHPHAGGVYESLVRLAQDWSLRYPLVQPQGNFGSIDGLPPAAMRYTEARLNRISLELMENISERVVEFIDNFDGEEREPTVLPVKIPHLLLNGSYGIAVGISSNIPPHHLNELMSACIAIIDDPQISVDDLMTHVTAPDFPTGGTIIGLSGIRSLYLTGRGSMRIRSKIHLETNETHKVSPSRLVVTEIPYLQNKATIITQISKLIDDNSLRGVMDVRDLSKEDIRIEIDIDEQYADDLGVKTILGQLYKKTNLDTLFHSRMTAFVYGRPMTLTLKKALAVFLDFRETTIRNITQEELDKVAARIHILEGLIIASDHIDAVIALIRASESRSAAHTNLKDKYALSDIQAKAVLDMTLARLARVEQTALVDELETKNADKARLMMILHDRPTLLELMRNEFEDIKKKHSDKRRTNLVEMDDVLTSSERPILHRRNLLITSTGEGYLRALDYTKFKTQGRGGRGVIGVPLGTDEKLFDMMIASNMDDLLLITHNGIIHLIPAYEIPEAKSRTNKGKTIKRFLPVEGSIVKVVNIEHDQFVKEKVLVTITKNGVIKRTTLDKYANIRRTGIKCLNLRGEDEVVDAFVTDGNSFIFIASKKGQAVVFDETKARAMGRVAGGVRGMRLRVGDEVVSSFAIPKDQLDQTSILTVTERGYGKRTILTKYRFTNRGVRGVINMKIREKNGDVVISMPMPIVAGSSNISLVNSDGVLIKVRVKGIRNMGRSTMGVRVMRIVGDQKLLMATSIVDENVEILEQAEIDLEDPIDDGEEDEFEVLEDSNDIEEAE
ncbi:MAG: DNA gyrase subunit A [Candidatus Heimdallarchaeota archaeon LC_2]|nr:MAG: DNA gyrase subunit A [Candidatus Heimdallarchaeota archaeon LC_2]